MRSSLASAVLAALLATACCASPNCDIALDPYPAGGFGGSYLPPRGRAGASPAASAGGGGGGITLGCRASCPPPLVCIAGSCAREQAPCLTDGDCQDDSACVAGGCVRHGDGAASAACRLAPPIGILSPVVKCAFVSPPAGDRFPEKIDVQATPMVARLDSATPSIVVPFGGGIPEGVACLDADCENRFGVVRILSGADCSLQQNLGGTDLDGNGRVEWARSSSPVALADLDGDKIPEVVVFMVELADPATGAGTEITVAFTNKGDGWTPLWPGAKAHRADGTVFAGPSSPGGSWAGPSVHDVDNDGDADIVREGYVIDGPTGLLTVEAPPDYVAATHGTSAVVAQLDQDPGAELTDGSYVWGLDLEAHAWVRKPAWQKSTSGSGFAAVEDFDPHAPFSVEAVHVATVSSGKMTIMSLDHTLERYVEAALPSGGGGPPVVADFDGDGLPEVGVATAGYYLVIDPDCSPAPRSGGACASRDQCEHAPLGACPTFVLWSRAIQDRGAGEASSAAFDFDGDGRLEIVHGDECFTRIYDGAAGRVLWSQYRSAGLRQDGPVVADVDGDRHADLVIGSSGSLPRERCAGFLETESGVDRQHAGVRCLTADDCPSQACDAGLCRCETSAQCCGSTSTDEACIEAGLACVAPPKGTAGSGLTCRASYPHGRRGLRIYSDARDRWGSTEMIWNQHNYSPLAVAESGVVPQTESWPRPSGHLGFGGVRRAATLGSGMPDLTAQLTIGARCVTMGPGTAAANLEGTICNRGSETVSPGVQVGFYVGEEKVCVGVVAGGIEPGKCAIASCLWDHPPPLRESAAEVRVVANDGGGKKECLSSNNEGRIVQVSCYPSQ